MCVCVFMFCLTLRHDAEGLQLIQACVQASCLVMSVVLVDELSLGEMW